MRLYLQFEKGFLAGLLVGLLAVAVLVASGSDEVATEALGSTLALLVHAALGLVSALAGGLFAVVVGRWAFPPWRGVLLGLALGGIALLLREPIAGLVAVLLRERLPVDLTDLIVSIPRVSSRMSTEAFSAERAELIVRVAAALLYGVLWGLLYGALWRWSFRHQESGEVRVERGV